MVCRSTLARASSSRARNDNDRFARGAIARVAQQLGELIRQLAFDRFEFGLLGRGLHAHEHLADLTCSPGSTSTRATTAGRSAVISYTPSTCTSAGPPAYSSICPMNAKPDRSERTDHAAANASRRTRAASDAARRPARRRVDETPALRAETATVAPCSAPLAGTARRACSLPWVGTLWARAARARAHPDDRQHAGVDVELGAREHELRRAVDLGLQVAERRRYHAVSSATCTAAQPPARAPRTAASQSARSNPP